MQALMQVIRKASLEQNIRFNCSDISCLAGYHPFQDVTACFEKYLYQDLDQLRELDAKRLGIPVDLLFASVEKVVTETVSHLQGLAGEQLQILSSILKTATTEKDKIDLLSSQVQAKVFIEKLDALLEKAEIAKQLSVEDIEMLRRELSGQVRKAYGTNCEETALDKYESETGFSVVERNERVYVLEIPHITVDLTLTDEKRELTQKVRTQNEFTSSNSESFASASIKSSSMKTETTFAKPKAKRVKPAFCLVGKVDGVSYQLDTSSNNAEDWHQIKVLVEMKNRTSKIRNPPPLYEQIQLVAYMIMLDCSHGDLVQAISQNSSFPESTAISNADTTYGQVSNGSSNNDFSITRIALNAAPYYHLHYWNTVIIPRLHVFRDAIMALRMNDDMRSLYIVSNEDERFAIISCLCPYF